MLEIIKIAIILIGTAYAAYRDHKTTIIPDYVNYPLLALGTIFLFLQFPLARALESFGIAVGIFCIGLVLYFAGQFGGGDVKLFTALALFLPTYPTIIQEIIPLGQVNPPYPFVVSIFFLSAVIAVFVISIDYLEKIWEDKKDIKKFKEKVMKGAGFIALLIPLFVIWSIISTRMLFLFPPMALGSFLLAFKKDLLERYVSKDKKVSKLTEDDVISLELIDEDKKEKLELGMSKTMPDSKLDELKEKAREHDIKKIKVNENLPTFGPFILVSLIVNLVFGDFFLWLMMA